MRAKSVIAFFLFWKHEKCGHGWCRGQNSNFDWLNTFEKVPEITAVLPPHYSLNT